MDRHLSRTLLATAFASSLVVGSLGCDDSDEQGEWVTGGGGTGATSSSGGDAGEGGGGTGGEPTGGSGGRPGAQEVGVTWTIAVEGEARDCFYAGASYVELAISDETGVVETPRFSCDAPDGGVVELAPGAYTVTPALLAFDESVVFEAPAQDLVVASTGDAALPVAFALPGARLSASWSLTSGGLPATCLDFGAHTAEILASNAAGFGYVNTFDCALGTGTTDFIPLGTYEVVVSLLYEQDVVLVSSDFIDATLDDAGETITLDPVAFDVVLP